MATNKKKLILIIDDEEPICRALKDRFVQEGYDVIQALDGDAGLEFARKKHPDLILLDILMPKKHGIETLRELRKGQWGESVPVIVITNLPEGPEKKQAAGEGVTDFLIKSDIKLDEVVNIVKNKFQ